MKKVESSKMLGAGIFVIAFSTVEVLTFETITTKLKGRQTKGPLSLLHGAWCMVHHSFSVLDKSP